MVPARSGLEVMKEARVRTRAISCKAGLLAFSCVLAALSFSCAKRQAPLIPRAVLFGYPAKASPSVSPDGKRLAYTAPSRGVMNIWVRTMGRRDDRAVTRDSTAGIEDYLWAEDGAHLLYLQDARGNGNRRLYGVDIESGSVSDLTPFDSVEVSVLSHNARSPNGLLIEMNRDDPKLRDVYMLDMRSSALSLVAKNPGNGVAWVADANLVVRGVVEATPDGGFALLVRDAADSPWRTLVAWGPDDALSSRPLSFTRDGAFLYCIDSRGANAGRLVKISLADGSSRVVTEDPDYDVSDVLFDPETCEVQAAAFTKERREWIILDDSLEEDFGAIVSLDDGGFFVTSRDGADRTWVVGFTRDSAPISYYLYDRAAKRGDFLFNLRGELARYALAGMEPVMFTSRDSLIIHGYLTVPPEKVASKLPLVVRVHDGPWKRDLWGMNDEVQWLANRGYAVLQINYRGSAGYGKRFLDAGDKAWGGAMENDLLDGVSWAISQGIADPARVGIWGSGYGGYAALAGLAFTPDVFRCGIDINGPSDLAGWVALVSPRLSACRYALYLRVGDPLVDANLLQSRSPLHRAAAIKAPLLVAQGAKDHWSAKAQSDSIVATLKARGADVSYIVFADEGSKITKPANRLSFYEAAERFLARNLGGRLEEARNKR